MSKTAINSLKNRYNHIVVIFDNDKAGLQDGIKFSQLTGFTNIVLPQFNGGKDISDYFSIIKDNNNLTILLKVRYKNNYQYGIKNYNSSKY